jgi:hypothetical protein
MNEVEGLDEVRGVAGQVSCLIIVGGGFLGGEFFLGFGGRGLIFGGGFGGGVRFGKFRKMNNAKIDFTSFSTLRHSRKVKAKNVDKIKYLNRPFPHIPTVRNVVSIEFNPNETLFFIQTPKILYIFDNYSKIVLKQLPVDKYDKFSCTFVKNETIFILGHTHKQMAIYKIYDDLEILLSESPENPIMALLADVLENSPENEKKLPVKLGYWIPDQSIVTVLCKGLFFLIRITESLVHQDSTEIENEILPDLEANFWKKFEQKQKFVYGVEICSELLRFDLGVTHKIFFMKNFSVDRDSLFLLEVKKDGRLQTTELKRSTPDANGQTKFTKAKVTTIVTRVKSNSHNSNMQEENLGNSQDHHTPDADSQSDTSNLKTPETF